MAATALPRLAWVPTACTLALLAGCVTAPLGPTVAVLPGPGKSPEQFSADAGTCQQQAQTAIAGPTQNAQGGAATATAGSAMLGAAVGALFGAATGNAGAGAAWGAGTGLLVGGTSTAGAGAASSHNLQRQYDAIYAQCMARLGNAYPGQVARRSYRSSPPPQSAPPVPQGQFAVPPDAVAPPPGTPPPQGYGPSDRG